MLVPSWHHTPTTWDELKAAAAKLTQGGRYGVAFSAIASYEGTWQFLPFMWSNGGDETDIASPQVAGALQMWVDLVDSGSASRSVRNEFRGRQCRDDGERPVAVPDPRLGARPDL